MTPDPSQSGADDNGAAEPLTELLAQALAALEADGEPGVERLLLRYPEDADELRAALAELRGTGLLDEPRSELPERFGDFALEGRLGAGGMGVVFRARQLSLGRLVALKVLRPELLLFEGARDRFQREIDAVARLEHPAIVPILASGLAGGVPYFAMPLLRGGSGDDVVAALAAADPRRLVGADLHAAIGGDAATPDGDGVFANDYRQAVVRLVRKAALGIHHAHARGVLHRDLKPSNLMLTPDGQAIVLDFGLARGRDDARLTRTGSTAGSPAYMAPEQVRGEPADERTDVYALAATMHCLLGLRPPFPIACAEELRRRILAGEREDLRHRAGVPTELRLVLDRAMDLERHRRYPTALAFADDLQATLDGRAVTARRLPFAVRARRLVRRHRAVAAAVGVALLFLALLPLVLLWQQRRAAEVLTRQVDKTTAANSALAAANASLEEQVRRADRGVEVSIETVERLLANVAVDKLRNLPAALEMGADVLHDAIELFDRLVADERFRERIELARLRALYDLFELQDTLGRFDAAEQTAQQLQRGLAKWFAGAESVPAPVRLLLAKIHRLIASLRIKRGEMGSVAQHVEAARHGFEGLCDDAGQRPYALEELSMLATVDAELTIARRDARATEAALRRAVDYARDARAAGRPARHHQVARLNLSQFLRQIGQHVEALALADGVAAELSDLPDREVGWPVPRMVLAMACVQRFRVLQFAKRDAEVRPAFDVAIAALDGVVGDYPDATDARRLRAATSGNLARSLPVGEDAVAESLLRTAIADLEYVLRGSPHDEKANQFLVEQRKTYCFRLRRAGRWGDLEAVARELGAMTGRGTFRETAARDLIRCARQLPARAAALHEEALLLLLASHRAGAEVLVDDAMYAPLREDPRYAELRRPR